VTWQVEYTDEFEQWWNTLTGEEQESIDPGVLLLIERGPALGRPWVDTIKASQHLNMKELRSRGGHIRVLFAFDPRRTAILLIGGDKRHQWRAWYERMVPVADRLYDEYLATLRREGELP
jgi:hypothetical protein